MDSDSITARIDPGRLAPSKLDCERLLSGLAGYVVIADARGRIRWVNRAPTGRSAHQLVGKEFLGFVAEAHRALVRRAIEGIVAGGPAVELEARGLPTERWHRLNLCGLEEQQRVVGFTVHAVDIDDRKRIETEVAIARARLRTSTGAPPGRDDDDRRRFELMTDALPVLIAYVDKQRCYQYNNAVYERWFQTSREELRGRTLEQVLGTEAYAGIRGYVDAVLGGSPVTFETRIPYTGAGVRDVVARYVPDVTGDGEVAGFYALVEDVTARREAEAALRHREEELRQLQKMEAIGRLAGGIAHDFNNLLSTVTSGCSAALHGLDEDSPAARLITKVQRAAQRGTSMTRQLLLFSRRGELRTAPLDLDGLIGDTAVLLERLLESNVKLQVELEARSQIMADSGQVQQVLMNLAINARDAMPEGGQLKISTKRVVVGPEEAARHESLCEGHYAVLTVSDSGTGMDAQTQARIFEPFFTTKEPEKGTGLGLSTVFGIVQRCAGHIELETELGKGTAFHLYFPVIDQPSADPVASAVLLCDGEQDGDRQ